MTAARINVELFSCSGGMAEGFRRAGIAFDWVFDYDADACASYEKNHGHKPVRMDVRDLVRMARGGWRPGEIGLLVADPPCTPWSRAGKRLGTEDERDMLEETAELITILRPRAYLIGNVPGLQDSTSWHVVQRVIGGLGKHGYCVADYAQLDAADYGVPQHRIRPFWYGHLDGPCVRWPSPTHADPAHPSLPGLELQPWVTCRVALGHLAIGDLGRPVRLRWKDGFAGPDHRPTTPDEPAATITRNTHSDGSLLVSDRHPMSMPDKPSRGIRANRANTGAQGDAALSLCRRGSDPQSARVYSPDEVAPTVQGREDRIGRGATTLDWPWDHAGTTIYVGRLGPNAVVLSERAAAILQGFPETWCFSGETKKSRWSQIGMAMPPPLAEAVARAIREAMETESPRAGAVPPTPRASPPGGEEEPRCA